MIKKKEIKLKLQRKQEYMKEPKMLINDNNICNNKNLKVRLSKQQ